VSDPVPWREAWQSALYGSGGFYRRPAGPSGHFSTATQGATGAVLATTLWAWADRYRLPGIVDVGAGRGELLRHLYASAPDRPLVGIDVVGRPDELPEAVGWVESPGGALLPSGWRPDRALVVAHEWLDVVPCTVAEVAQDGSLREVLVDPLTGAETVDGPVSDADRQWYERFSGAGGVGDRVEIGRQRDDAWSALLDRLPLGSVAVAVDYGHEAGDRPAEGTLAAYQQGRLVDPVPDGTRDLTAHVAVDSLKQTRRLRQREAVPSAEPPDHGIASRDPAAYLAALADRRARTALRRPGGFGDFWWVVAER
jgi:SAM-dependent MidA family methyltransferase